MTDTTFEIPVRGVRSLSWDVNVLVDWVAGGTRFRLDGSVAGGGGSLGYSRFDAVAFSPSGRFRVAYERLGVTALISDYDRAAGGGRRQFQIHRDLDNAEFFEYPVALFALPDGREVMAHCPDDAYLLEVDDLATGERLTTRSQDEETNDGANPHFYHSRLSANSSGTKLMSAGWYWHPWDSVMIYDVATALADPNCLDRQPEVHPAYAGEVNSAAFCGDDLIVLTTTEVSNAGFDESGRSTGLRAQGKTIGLCDVNDGHSLSLAELEEPAGTLMVLNRDYVVGFYEYPKVIHVPTGRVVHKWPALNTGTQNSSIVSEDQIVPLAMDPANLRFAVADAEKITLVTVTGLPDTPAP